MIQSIDLHAFGDTSGKGVSAAVYAVVEQSSGTNQGLMAAKSRLAKKGLTIPRLELVSGHMATNLVHNVKEALQKVSCKERVLLVGQHRGPPLDPRERRIQTVRGQPRTTDPGEEIHRVETRGHRGKSS